MSTSKPLYTMRYITYSTLILIVLPLLINCGGNSRVTSAPTQGEPGGTPRFWATSSRNYAPYASRPTISIQGSKVIHLSTEEAYSELGAFASDLEDGDISDQIQITSNLSTEEGDYLVRYSLTDSDGNDALEAVRIVRIYEDTPANLTKRPVGETESHFGYIEHLPESYDANPQQNFPLIIYLHGGGSSASRYGQPTSELALDALLRFDGGLSQVYNRNSIPQLNSFVVLSPQLGTVADTHPIRIDAFLEFAKQTYNIDESRIYITGFSMGGYGALLYGAEHPEKIAAVVPVAAGFLITTPSNLCDLRALPIWGFTGDSDSVVTDSIFNAFNILEDCPSNNELLLTVYPGVDHFTPQSRTYSLRGMNTGREDFHPYSTAIYDWLLTHTNE